MFPGYAEAEALVEHAGGVVDFDVIDSLREVCSASAMSARRTLVPIPRPRNDGVSSDVHDPDVARPAVYVQPARRHAAELDDVERRTGVVLAVVGVLRVELVLDERAARGGIPRDVRELLLAHAVVEVDEKLAVVVGDRSQTARTPTRAEGTRPGARC